MHEPPSFLLWLVRLIVRPPAPGRPDRAAAWCATWTAAWAEALGVSRNRRGDWLVRLLFQPPRPGQPDRLGDGLRAAARRVAQALDLVPPYPASAQAWLARLLWRQSGRGAGQAAATRHAIAKATRRARRLTGALLGRLPWTAAAERFERWPARVQRVRWLMPVLLAVGLVAWLIVGTAPLSLRDQGRFFLVTLVLVLILRRLPGRLSTLTMMALSMLVALRYIWWRSTQTLQFTSMSEALVGLVLYLAEAYTWMILFLGYIQTAWPLQRTPKPLARDTAAWPTVDVFIPTYNEALSVVRPSVFAAQGMDWPADKLRVYVLDDGRRPEFRAFAREAGVGYLVRDDNAHAKAGNINRALTQTDGEYIAIFDCDHIPTRSFLQTTVGTLVADENCAMVQTPHHFFSPDPFERNFGNFRRIPNEGSLFYGLVQDGNDLWNASFFCGSCAVLKRKPLESIGGIAVETVTEDAHTALKLHRRGYGTAYLPVVQAAGLATESLAGHISQRIRWARGMAQIFRIDNPFFGKGLSFFQRLCYGNAMLHFFYGIPRLIFLTMPMAYLYFGMHFMNTSALNLGLYVLPYIMLANLANSRVQGKYRHSFWAEVYESVLAWYIVLPTTVAFIDPKLGKFNVTDKGGLMEKDHLDWSISRPYLILLGINVLGVVLGIGRLLIWNVDERPTVVMNLVWTVYNLIMLGAAVGVAQEARQVRVAHRNPMQVPATLLLGNGRAIACETTDYSIGGLGLNLPAEMDLPADTSVGISMQRGEREFHFSARTTRSNGRQLGVRFERMTVELERQLIQCTFGRADAWLDWNDAQARDKPLNGLQEVAAMGAQGYARLVAAVRRAASGLFVPAERQS